MWVVFFLAFTLAPHRSSTDRNVQESRAIEKQAMKEYYEKHGGSPGHH
jgi:hypothetical protein